MVKSWGELNQDADDLDRAREDFFYDEEIRSNPKELQTRDLLWNLSRDVARISDDQHRLRNEFCDSATAQMLQAMRDASAKISTFATRIQELTREAQADRTSISILMAEQKAHREEMETAKSVEEELRGKISAMELTVAHALDGTAAVMRINSANEVRMMQIESQLSLQKELEALGTSVATEW